MPPTPILDSIRSTADVRALAAGKLPELAAELRSSIMETVALRGGHLASNLGAVELTLALHRVFDFERDRLVFDVGHQCYAHKLLTGRAESFRGLRTRGGASGFPDPAESPCDPFITGHASTAVSMALGLACAERAAGRRAIAVVGDGAIAGGLAFEGLNHAGHVGADLLVVLNDNEMSISRTVGALARHLSHVRLDPHYNDLRSELGRLATSFPLLGNVGRKMADLARRTFTGGAIFQDLGFRYVGPVDGHDLEELESTLRSARELAGPVLLHVFTQKGRGHGPAAADPRAHHSTAPFKIRVNGPGDDKSADGAKADAAADAAAEAKPSPPTYSAAMVEKLLELARADERIVAITAAMADGTGLSRMASEFPKRFHDVGITEAHAVTFASGLARGGKRPVVTIYSTFLQRAYDSIFHDLCLQGSLGAVVCVDRAGLVGSDGPTHHGLFDIASLRALPNMTLAAPRDGADLALLLEWALGCGKPVAIRYPRTEVPEPVSPAAPVELGRGETLVEGEGVAVLAYGSMVAEAALALEELAREGIRPTLASARFAKPLDVDLLARLARGHERVITVEEGALVGGLGSAVLEAGGQAGLDPAKVTRLGVPDRFIAHASRAEQLAECGLDARGIARAVREAIAGDGGEGHA
jgi:1-deoxy-D-xylulose-5-phosphate synthase